MKKNCYACERKIQYGFGSFELIQLEGDSEDDPTVVCSFCAKLYKELDVKSEISYVRNEAQEMVEKIEKAWLSSCQLIKKING
jgi:hypothetical protein